MTVTDEQLAACEGHTPGPWYVGYSDGSGTGEGDDGIYITHRLEDCPEHGVVDEQPCIVSGCADDWGCGQGVHTQQDAVLISLAPVMRVALIEARAEIERLRGAIDKLTEFIPPSRLDDVMKLMFEVTQ